MRYDCVFELKANLSWSQYELSSPGDSHLKEAEEEDVENVGLFYFVKLKRK